MLLVIFEFWFCFFGLLVIVFWIVDMVGDGGCWGICGWGILVFLYIMVLGFVCEVFFVFWVVVIEFLMLFGLNIRLFWGFDFYVFGCVGWFLVFLMVSLFCLWLLFVRLWVCVNLFWILCCLIICFDGSLFLC